MKARSRLQSVTIERQPRVHSGKLPEKLAPYLPRVPLLLLSLPLYGIVLALISRYYPAQLEDVLISNTYLPLQLPLLGANGLFFSFLFLHTRRGVLTAVLLSLLLFLRLQNVIFEWRWFLPLLLLFAILELGLSKFSQRHANIEKKPIHSPRRSYP